MNEAKLKQRFTQFIHALDELEQGIESVNTSKSDSAILMDGVLLRFVRVMDNLTKVLRLLLLREGLDIYSPLEALRHAYQLNWIQNESAWLDLINDRTEIMHAADKISVAAIFENINKHFAELEKLKIFLKQKMS